jgi:Flp pilus assembly protein TadD
MTVDTGPRPVGVDLLAEGRFEDALAPLRLTVSLGDTTPTTILNLAIAEDRAGDRDRARRLIRLVASQFPAWDEPILRLAESLRAGGESTTAEEKYRQVLELNPCRQEAMMALAGLLLMRGEPEQARDLLLRCCGIAPDNAEAWNALGLALRETGAFSLALSAFVNAQRLRPDQVDYVLNGVEVTLNANEGDAELARLTVACEHTPLNPALQVGRGMLLDLLGCKVEAIDALEAATQMAPDAIVPLRLLSRLLARSGRLDYTEKVMRRLCALDSDNRHESNNHAAVLMKMHRFGEARVILLENLELHGPSENALCNLANTTACLGEQDEAAKIARQAIERDPSAVLPRRALCSVLPYCEGITGTKLLEAMRDCSAVLSRTRNQNAETIPNRTGR